MAKEEKGKVPVTRGGSELCQVEDYGAPELVVEVDGCTIPKVPVDGGSGVNLMLESTAFDLSYTTFEETNQILRMVDQSRVVPAGRLFNTHSDRAGNLPPKLCYHLCRNRKAISYASRKTMVVLCQGFSGLGCQGIYSWQTSNTDSMEDREIPWRNE